MSAKSGGSMATLLMSVPLAAIPLMAIFGIPQFAPVVASPDGGEAMLGEPVRYGEDGTSYRRRAADLLDDYAESRHNEALTDAPPYVPITAGDEYDAGGREGRSNRGAALRAGEFRSRTPRMNDTRVHDSHAAARDGRSGEPSAQNLAFASQQAEGGTPQPAPFDAGSAARFSETGGTAHPAQTPLTWREAARELEELGIQNFHLERGTEAQSFLFVCSFAPGDSPQVTLRFEAEAQEPLAAVGNVLDQVNVWLRQRFAASRSLGATASEQP